MPLIEIFKVTIDHFRGYRGEQIFDLESGADVIILAGSNGYGKTSVFDAIEWGFTGKLSRFEEPNEEKNNSCFINFQPFECNGKVCIEFGNKDSRYYLTRQSTYLLSDSTDYSIKKSTMWIEGNGIGTLRNDYAINFLNELFIKEEWKDRISFTDIFSQYHVLTQDKIKKFIQGLKAPDRYKQVSMMVGTQKFYSYKNFFEKESKVFNDNAKALADKKNGLLISINSIKELVNNNIKINIGDCKTVEEWVDHLIKKYNIANEGLNIEKFSINKDSDLLAIMVDLKTHAIQNKENLINIKNSEVAFKEKISDVKHNLKNYEQYKSELKVYNAILPVVDRGHKLLRLQKQLPLVKEYNGFMQKIEFNILKVTNALKQTEIYLMKLTTLYNQIDFLLNEVDIKKRSENTIEKLFTNEISFLQNNIPKFDDTNEIIIDNKSISFLEYKQTIDIEIRQKMNLNDLIKASIEFYNKNIKQELVNITGVEQSILDLEKKMLDFENEIKGLSKIESDLKGILAESLTYVKSNSIDLDIQINCPVCDSYFNKGILIEKIEKKLIDDNQSLASKIKDKNDIQIQLNTYKESIFNSKELYKQFNGDFIYRINSIKNSVTLLGQLVRKQEKEYNGEIKNLNEESLKTQEKQIDIITIINSMNLSNDANELEVQIISELNQINDTLKQREFNLDSLRIDEVKNIIITINQNINSYERKLDELKINKTSIEEDIENKILEIDKHISILEKTENNIKGLEESFNEAYRELSNSKKMGQLKNLEEQYKQLNTQEQNETNAVRTMEKLIEASTEAIQEISKDILTQHQEFINTIYKRINPHPLFTEVEFNFDKNNKGNDILNINCVNSNLDNIINNKVNPAFTFSSAQVNVVAVSVFLGMALRQQCSNLRTIMLDDPIQNMDDMNVISFIDILRNCLSINSNESNNKQIIISTHDQDFYRLMVKKFRFVKNKSFEFIGYNNQGPEIR